MKNNLLIRIGKMTSQKTDKMVVMMQDDTNAHSSKMTLFDELCKVANRPSVKKISAT